MGYFLKTIHYIRIHYYHYLILLVAVQVVPDMGSRMVCGWERRGCAAAASQLLIIAQCYMGQWLNRTGLVTSCSLASPLLWLWNFS